MKIAIQQLTDLIDRILVTKYSQADAVRIREIILSAELSGKTSHGIVRLISGNTSMMAANPSAPLEVINKSPIASLIKANSNPGMLVMSYATDEVIGKANSSGVAFVGTVGTTTTSGYLSYYLRKIAKAGLIGLIMARSSPTIAPFGSKRSLLGTNPIGFGFPGEKQDFIFDMGSSVISYGALLKARSMHEDLPEGACLDKDGNPTINPDEAKSILPFDKGYKGAGIALVVEILAGLLVGSGFSDLKPENQWGNLLIAFKPDMFISNSEFKTGLDSLIEYLNANTEGDLPGQRSNREFKQKMDECFVECDENVVGEMEKFLK